MVTEAGIAPKEYRFMVSLMYSVATYAVPVKLQPR